MTHPIPTAKIQAILFDLDGTLIDSDDVAVRQLAQRFSFLSPARATRLARTIIMKVETPGNAAITLLDLLHLDQPIFRLKERWQTQAAHFHLIPGVSQMLGALDGRYRLGLVTTRSRRDVDDFLAQYPAISARVAISCSAEDTRRLKPHPQPVRSAAAGLGLSPAQCLMVGDTTVDVRAARRAGAWSVGVLCGFGEQRELRRAGAHAILPSTGELGRLWG
ncbi:MAG: HAD family hydrolase [Anaerolineales bacterium]|nr:HAD family hydrolase [Anaerolineales bacterium]MCB8953843.1 HAD family hydrolase [Ardenticatenales bacterium]